MSARPGDDAPLSIVIPTRNRLGFLQECLASIMSGPPTWRVIIVDDASDDGTEEWLGALNDARVETVTLPDRSGAAAARNQGLQRVDTPLVMFMDDDDLLISAAADELAGRLLAQPTAVAAVGRSVDLDEQGQCQPRLGPSQPRVDTVFAEVLAGWCPSQGAAVFRTEVIRAAGGWSTNVTVPCEDYELWLRIAQVGPVALSPAVAVQFRIHENQRTWHEEEAMHCVAKELSRNAARRSKAPLKAARVHLAAWNRYRAASLNDRGHLLAAAASYLAAMLLSPELRRSVVMGPDMRDELRRIAGEIRRRRPLTKTG